MTMTQPTLTVQRLVEAGFAEVGGWELNSERDLVHRVDLPKQAGVYAFSINGIVHYVGLASKSLRQRLGFYRKPGASQRTNIRLNEIIRDHIARGTIVQILIAHPPDREWNGFIIRGAEGLEAGLIGEFDLPWNVRGSAQRIMPEATAHQRKDSMEQGSVADRIIAAVRERSGMTELEIARRLFGPRAAQQRVNQDCRLLVQRGLLERRGTGGVSDPFVYHARN
jgi:hypothetical protein